MTAQDFQLAKQRRMLQLPVWWLAVRLRAADDIEHPVSGDEIARVLKLDPRPATRDDKVWRSFSKKPDSPRFPTPPFARVPLTDRKKK